MEHVSPNDSTRLIIFKTNRAINSLAHTQRTPEILSNPEYRFRRQDIMSPHRMILTSWAMGLKNLVSVILQEPIKRLHAQKKELSPQHSFGSPACRPNHTKIELPSSPVLCVSLPPQPQLSPCAQKKPSSANIFAFIGYSNIHDDAIGLRDSSEPVNSHASPPPPA